MASSRAVQSIPRPPRHAWLLCLAPLIASAWTRDWWAPDEPRYAEVSREIVATGQYLVMHLCGEVYPNKPPLLFWIAGGFGRLANWSEWAVRLPSLLATLASAWLAARLARRFWGEDEARWAPILYLTTTMVLWHGARLQIDPLLGALCLGAVVAASEPAPRSRTRALLLAGTLTGLGVLAKGPIAFVLVLAPLGLWRWLLGPHPLRAPRVAWMAALLASLAPALLWALAVVAREPALAYDLFVGQFFERAVAGTNHLNPPWYHLLLQPQLMLPWSLPMLAGSWLAVRALRARRAGLPFDAGLVRAGVWFWGLLLLFSLSPEKRDLYLLPAYPAAALLGARWLCETLRARRAARWIVLPAAVLLVLVGAAATASGAFAERLPDDFPQLSWQPVAIGACLVLGAGWAVVRGARGGTAGAILGVAIGWTMATTLAALSIFPLINPRKSARSLAHHLVQRPERPSAIPCVGVMPEGFRYYSGLPVVHGPNLDRGLPDALESQEREFLALAEREGPQFLALVRRENWEDWSAATRATLEIRHEQTVGTREILVIGVAPPH